MGLGEQQLTFLRGLVYDKSAIVIEAGKEYLVEARLGPIAREQGFADIDALVGHLRSGTASALQTRVVEAMTTNETTFFRDIHPFTVLRSDIFPQLIEKRKLQRSIDIWCGAASTGQEPYSVVMLMREHFPELTSWRIRFTATDINNAVLERAREGVFKSLEINRGLPAPMLVKYFERHGADYRIKEDLRKMVTFTPLNLIGTWPPMGNLDIVFLRNVLIYFDVPTKKKILGRVFDVMAPGGALFLGGAETTLNLDARFERVQVDKAVCYRRP